MIVGHVDKTETLKGGIPKISITFQPEHKMGVFGLDDKEVSVEVFNAQEPLPEDRLEILRQIRDAFEGIRGLLTSITGEGGKDE